MFGLGPLEMVCFGVIAVVLFGSNLPDVARKLGTQYASLRSSLNEVQKEFRQASGEIQTTFRQASPDSLVEDDLDEAPAPPKAPKFKPPV